MGQFKKIGIVYNRRANGATDVAGAIRSKYGSGYEWWQAPLEGHERYDEETLDNTDLLLAIGGDGTLLKVATSVAGRDIPVLGINAGRLGFLMELECKDAEEGIAPYLDGKTHIEEHTLLRASTPGSDEYEDALNDVVIHRGNIPKAIEIKLYLNGVEFDTYRGDGLLVSTATGSTAYARSLGAPLMDPTSANYMITPIAAGLKLYSGIVVKSDFKLKAVMIGDDQDITLTVDNRPSKLAWSKSREIELCAAPWRVKLLRKDSCENRWRYIANSLNKRSAR